MTLRRWRKEPGDRELPKLYSRALDAVICELAAEGKLNMKSPLVQNAVVAARQAPFAAILANLGITWDPLKTDQFSEPKLIECLSQIGADTDRQKEIDRNSNRILLFKNRGKEWRRRISSLMTAIRSKNLHGFDKQVAFGALFYLLSPFDMIPENIPVFGYMDDIIMLELAAAYYVRRFPQLYPKLCHPPHASMAKLRSPIHIGRDGHPQALALADRGLDSMKG